MTSLESTLLSQLFSTLSACEKIGLFEWDLCAGNLLVDEQQQLWLFDFGYMYEFDPLTQLNSNGMGDPLFQFCERFETRFLSGWLLQQGYSHQQSLAIFKTVKQAALTILAEKQTWQKSNQVNAEVIRHTESLQTKYLEALESKEALENLFTLEMFRSHVLDIEDDLEGKSCTPTTIKRVETVLAMLDKSYPRLVAGGALFYQNEGKSKAELTELYRHKLRLANQYQL